MVVAERCERKIVGLLINSSTYKQKGNKDGWNEFCRTRTKLLQLKRSNPEQYKALLENYLSAIAKIEQALKD